jgi:RNA polymerase sigma-70 factor (ECF subfamily)
MVLEAAVDGLPRAYRSVFMLRDIEGMSTAETAECLGINKETVRLRLHRARSILRKEISAKTGAATASAFQFLGERCEILGSAVLKRISAIHKEELAR